MGNVSPAVKKYFWDTDFQTLDLCKHRQFILERILEMGDEDAVKWMQEHFTKEDILETLEHSRRISPKSRNYWNFIYENKVK